MQSNRKLQFFCSACWLPVCLLMSKGTIYKEKRIMYRERTEQKKSISTKKRLPTRGYIPVRRFCIELAFHVLHRHTSMHGMYVMHVVSAQCEVKTPHFSTNREAVVSKTQQAAEELTEFFKELKQRHQNIKGLNMEIFCWERKLRGAIKNINSKWNGIHEKHRCTRLIISSHTALFISATTWVFVSCSHSVTGSTSTALINLLQEGTYDGDFQMRLYYVCIMKNF